MFICSFFSSSNYSVLTFDMIHIKFQRIFLFSQEQLFVVDLSQNDGMLLFPLLFSLLSSLLFEHLCFFFAHSNDHFLKNIYIELVTRSSQSMALDHSQLNKVSQRVCVICSHESANDVCRLLYYSSAIFLLKVKSTGECTIVSSQEWTEPCMSLIPITKLSCCLVVGAQLNTLNLINLARNGSAMGLPTRVIIPTELEGTSKVIAINALVHQSQKLKNTSRARDGEVPIQFILVDKNVHSTSRQLFYLKIWLHMDVSIVSLTRSITRAMIPLNPHIIETLNEQTTSCIVTSFDQSTNNSIQRHKNLNFESTLVAIGPWSAVLDPISNHPLFSIQVRFYKSKKKKKRATLILGNFFIYFKNCFIELT